MSRVNSFGEWSGDNLYIMYISGFTERVSVRYNKTNFKFMTLLLPIFSVRLGLTTTFKARERERESFTLCGDVDCWKLFLTNPRDGERMRGGGLEEGRIFIITHPAFRTAPVQLKDAAVPVFALYGEAMILSPSSSSEIAVVKLIRSSSLICKKLRAHRIHAWQKNMGVGGDGGDCECMCEHEREREKGREKYAEIYNCVMAISYL
jgi:hypothetical protein